MDQDNQLVDMHQEEEDTLPGDNLAEVGSLVGAGIPEGDNHMPPVVEDMHQEDMNQADMHQADMR